MCYSAQILSDFHKCARTFGADIDIATFVKLYVEREQGGVGGHWLWPQTRLPAPTKELEWLRV